MSAPPGKFANPTPLKVGMSGLLNGGRVRVVARLVLGMEDGGETYYWNEYVLEDDAGNAATLVYEEGEHGPDWKIFRDLVPDVPMSAREAATRRVGDTVRLSGGPARVTLVDSSRVYYIEGRAPEGVAVGDVANYFNADSAGRMLVASWTGEEIEFYEGTVIPAAWITQGFNLPASRAAEAPSFRPQTPSGPTTMTKIVLGALAVLTLVTAVTCSLGRRPARAANPKRSVKAAPAFQLSPGARGLLDGTPYELAAHARVEIARLEGRQERHEYQLTGDAGAPALLVHGLTGSLQWYLLRPAEPPVQLSPYDAATHRKGGTVSLDGRTLRVAELFQSRALSTRGDVPAPDAWAPLQYGYVAQDGGEWVLVRWTEQALRVYRGRPVRDADVTAAFAKP